MPIVILVLILLGFLLAAIGGVIDLIEAFRESIVWGLLYVFIPFASLVFVIIFWRRKWVRNGFLISLLGTLILFGAIALGLTVPGGLQQYLLEDGVLDPSTLGVPDPTLTAPGDGQLYSGDPQQAFGQGVRLATAAAEKTQAARSPQQWAAVAQDWQGAIASMEAVSAQDPKFAIAQQKVKEYQKNLAYAQKNAR